MSDGLNGESEVEAPDSNVRPDYDVLKAWARQYKRPEKTLVAQALNTDPFYAGVGSRKAAAEWFAELWEEYQCRVGMHLRGIHYILISQENGTVKIRSILIYENNTKCWQALVNASRDARLLGLVPPYAFEDRRNAKPIEYLPKYAFAELSVESKVVWIEPETLDSIYEYPIREHQDIEPLQAELTAAPKELWIPNIESPEISEPDELSDAPEVSVKSQIQPPFFHLEIWCEKTTMNHILDPLAREYNMNLITGSGYMSLTHCRDLIERAKRSRLPVRIFYISDLDLSGQSMPSAVARSIEFLAWGKGLDIQLRSVALTFKQCEELKLPRTPIKESVGKKAKAKFEARFASLTTEKKGAVELDALEALHPGYLRALLVKHIECYQDPTFRERAEESQTELESEIEDMRDKIIEAHPELDELRDEHSDLVARRNNEVEELLSERLDALNQEINQLTEEPITELNQKIGNIKEEVGEIAEEIKEQFKDRLDALNKQIDEINEAARPLYTEARELAQTEIPEINSAIEDIERSYADRIADAARQFKEAQEVVETELKAAGQEVIDAFEWPQPVAAVADDEPLFDSKRPYLEQIEHYKKHSGKLTERKRFKHAKKQSFPRPPKSLFVHNRKSLPNGSEK